MSPFQVIPLRDATDADAFVAAHPTGTIFHTRAFNESLEASPENDVYAVVARDCDGKIRALIAAVRITTTRLLAGRFASRSVMYAEPLCTDDDDGRQALAVLLRAHDTFMSRQALFTEVRPLFAQTTEREVLEANEYDCLGYHNYELALDVPEETLWGQLASKCRSDIRRSKKKGVIVREGDRSADLDTFYTHLEESYGRSQVPLADKSMFAAAFQLLPPDQLRFTIAEYQGEPVASACHLIFGGRVFYWYAGVVRVKGIAANTCLLWDAIQVGANSGQQIYDFGGAGWEGEDYGPGKFKSQFGGTHVSYGRYRRVYAKWSFRLAETAYGYARRFLAPPATTKTNADNRSA